MESTRHRVETADPAGKPALSDGTSVDEWRVFREEMCEAPVDTLQWKYEVRRKVEEGPIVHNVENVAQ